MKIVVFAPDSSERSPLAGAVSALSTAMAELSEDADIEFVGVAGRVEDLSADQLEFALFDVDDGSAAEQIAREQRLAAIGDAAAAVTGEVSWQDPAWNTISAIADADAVLILGTGSAQYRERHQVYGLSAVVEIASVFGKPIALSGQRFFEGLAGRDLALVESAIRSATIVGVADRQSLEWALHRGVSVTRLGMSPLDFPADESASRVAPDDHVPGGYVVADFRELDNADLFQAPLSRLVKRIWDTTGLQTIVLPADLERGPMVDSDMSLTDESPDSTRALVERAALVVSGDLDLLRVASRAGVPFIGVGSKPFSASVLSGALDRIGMPEWALTSGSLGSEDLALVIDESWTRHGEIAAHLQNVMRTDSSFARSWWKDVASALGGRSARLSDSVELASLTLMDRDLAARITFACALARRVDSDQARQQGEWQERREELERAADGAVRAELTAGELHAELLNTQLLLAAADAELAAAHALAAKVTEPIFARALRPPVVPHSDNALNDLLQTRAVRWSRAVRRLYSRPR